MMMPTTVAMAELPQIAVPARISAFVLGRDAKNSAQPPAQAQGGGDGRGGKDSTVRPGPQHHRQGHAETQQHHANSQERRRNLFHLALFRAVAEAGDCSRAAETIHVSQPAISMQVAELEESLGTPLFDRLPRGVRLADAGLRPCSATPGGSGTLEAEAERAMRELRGLARGRLALGASTTIGSYLLPAVLGEFRRHPAVECS